MLRRPRRLADRTRWEEERGAAAAAAEAAWAAERTALQEQVGRWWRGVCVCRGGGGGGGGVRSGRVASSGGCVSVHLACRWHVNRCGVWTWECGRGRCAAGRFFRQMSGGVIALASVLLLSLAACSLFTEGSLPPPRSACNQCPPLLFQVASLQAESQKAQAQVSKAKLVLATSKKATAAAEAAAEEALARAAAAEAAAREACTAQAAVEQLEGRLREVEAELERAQGGPADGFVLGTLGHVPCTCGTRRTQPLSFRDRRGHKHNYGVAGTAWDVAVHVNAAPQTPRPCCNHACAGHTSICCSCAFDEPLRPCGSPLRRRGAAAGAGAR